MVEKIEIGKYYKAIIISAIIFMVLTVAFVFLIFPNEETNAIIKTNDKGFGGTGQTFDKNCYDEIMKNGNIVLGNEFFSTKTICFYFDGISDNGEKHNNYIALDRHNHNYWAVENLPEKATLVGDYWISIVNEKVTVAKTYSSQQYAFDFEIEDYTNDYYGFSREKIAELLKKQRDDKIELLELAALISLTKDNILLNYDGENAVMADFKNEKNGRNVTFILVNEDGNEESIGPFICSADIPVMSVNGLLIWANGDELHIYNYKDKKEEIIEGDKTGGKIISLNYSAKKDKTDIWFLTGGKIHLIKSYDKKYEIDEGKVSERSKVVYIDYYQNMKYGFMLLDDSGTYSNGSFD